MLSILVTGSDTGVGKTHCVGQLAAFFAKQNKQVQIVKPVETGVNENSLKDALHAKSLALKEGVSDTNIEAITGLTFSHPLAPFYAAKLEAKELSFDLLVSTLYALKACDVRIYEGAGGVASPLTKEGQDWVDFAEALNVDIILYVVRDQLGAINQARLGISQLEKTKIRTGVWLNEIDEAQSHVLASNRAGLEISGISLFAETRFKDKKTVFSNDFKISLDTKVLRKEDSFLNRISLDLQERDAKHLRRKVSVFDETLIKLNLAANDYLNLAHDPKLISETRLALEKYGTSASASALITGWTKAHEDTLQALCQWHQFSNGLIWSSGFAANSAILSTLPKEGDLILADKLIHNSMIAGIKRSGATFKRYPHLDLTVLETLLKEAYEGSASYRTIFVVTESVFSMDGDYPDLRKIASLKAKYPFVWILDEAHALGWYGKTGAGLAEAQQVTSQVDIFVGTLGKTLASSGAYTLFHNPIVRDYLINHASEFIYSTALAPSNALVAISAINRIKDCVVEQTAWHALSRDFRQKLIAANFETLQGESPIIPVMLKSEDAALSLKETLLKDGILVAAIRPPTVPPKSSRIRISLKRGVTEADLDHLLFLMLTWRNHHG